MEKYQLLHKVGSGGFAVTYKVRSKITGDVLAMKCLSRGLFDEKYVEREIMNHRDLRHPNVIQFKEVVLDDQKLGIVMEFADGGDLFDQVLLHDGPFSEDKARKMFQQLVAGVNYIHLKRIGHRDLKPENTLLASNGGLKICDFGLSKSSRIHSCAKSELGTPGYWAPEVHSGLRYDGKLADIWSCGVILYLMLTKYFPDHNNAAHINKLRVSDECKDLLRRMLVVNPTMRILIEDIMDHPWYLTDLPLHLTKQAQADFCNDEDEILSYQNQSEADIENIIKEAKVPPQILAIVEEEAETVQGENGAEDKLPPPA